MRFTLLLSLSVHLCSAVALNVAQGKPAYQPDTYADDHWAYDASLAVDGNVAHTLMGGSCTHTMATGDVSWEVDLQGIYVIKSVKLYNRFECCSERLSDVELLIGMSREGFHERAGFHPGAVGATFTFVLDTPMYGRWVKVANHSPGNPLTLCEVEVEGDSWTPKEVTGSHKYGILVNRVHTGQAIDITRNIPTNIVCALRCSKTQNCLSAHYNRATLT